MHKNSNPIEIGSRREPIVDHFLIDHLDGVLFVDRVTDPATLATWDEFTAHHRDAFVERITAFVAEVGARGVAAMEVP